MIRSVPARVLLLGATALATTLAACVRTAPAPSAAAAAPAPDVRLVDPAATAETRALLANLHRVAREHVLFGHQDDLAYGVEWVAEPGRSDVRETAGSYPAVYGWDVSKLEVDSARNIDGVDFARMRDWIREGYARGGVITISWHMDNPVSGGSSWDTTRAVAAILPGGTHHATYRGWLDRFADFATSLRAPARAGGGEVLVPVVFRPFHEMSGSWFWWGGRHVTPEEYRALWRFTVAYLRDERRVHNLLWAYSPNTADGVPGERYWEWYPGDDWVDVLGLDDYSTLQRGAGAGEAAAAMGAHLAWLVRQAGARGKLAAFTETGYETIPDSTWWTDRLLAALTAEPEARGIAWVLVWRNANRAGRASDHYYAPYPGHPSAASFVRFRQDPLVLFEDELPDLYATPAPR